MNPSRDQEIEREAYAMFKQYGTTLAIEKANDFINEAKLSIKNLDHYNAEYVDSKEHEIYYWMGVSERINRF
jgi:hypothetical protein